CSDRYELAQRLRRRAARNHRSLQGELMAIIEAASRPASSIADFARYTQIPRVAEKTACRIIFAGFCWLHDPERLPGQRVAARPDRVGSGRVGAASAGAAGQRTGAAG